MAEARDIVQQHGSMVWATLCRLIGAEHLVDVEDCFQEVFVAALEVGRREAVRNWEAMLRRIATSKGLDLLRLRVRQRGRENGDVAWEEVPATTGRAETPGERAELAREMRGALARLQAQEAEIFCLRHLEDMSYEEIGREVGMSAGAVGVALHRIRERLRGVLSTRNVWSQGEVRHD